MKRNQELLNNIDAELTNAWQKLQEYKNVNLVLEYEWLKIIEGLIHTRVEALGLPPFNG